jgi:hypothetical protein
MAAAALYAEIQNLGIVHRFNQVPDIAILNCESTSTP